MNGAESLIHDRARIAASMSVSPTPAPPRCRWSRRSTPSRECARCWAVRGRLHRRGRRLRADGRPAGADADPSRTRLRQRYRQPAQRAARPLADRQRHRRSCDLASGGRRAAHLRYRIARPPGLRMGAPGRIARRGRAPTRPRRSPRPATRPAIRRHAYRSVRLPMEPGRRRRPAASARGACRRRRTTRCASPPSCCGATARTPCSSWAERRCASAASTPPRGSPQRADAA